MNREQRIAELRAEVAKEKNDEERRTRETNFQQQVAMGVLKAVEKVEEALDSKIRTLEDVENMGDEELEAIRQRKIQQMKENSKKAEKWRNLGHGEYRTVSDEKDFFSQVKASERLVVHFGRNATPRCEILDGHLTKLARKHIETKFIRVEAERSPFLSDRLKINVLPSIVLVKNGKTEHTLVGFEEFGVADDFPSEVLEKTLAKHGVINKVEDDFGLKIGRHNPGIRKGNVSLDDWED